uniref:Uncharacterized protein n=1 Tax=Tabanus bromius TaxID=304241 RepID=A0A0K8TPN2_TABBR
MAHTWIHSDSYSSLPPSAVFAGNDSNGDAIYVGRALCNGDQVPCKVIPDKNAAFLPYDGREIPATSYEVLCGHGYTWVPSVGGQILPHAVIGGRTSDGEPLYIGRANYAGSITPGKVHPSHNCLYIGYGGREVRVDSYEILISDPGPQWVGVAIGQHLPNAVQAGLDSDGHSIYVARAYHGGDQLVAKYIPGKQAAYVSFDGDEVLVPQIEVLVGHNYTWVASANGHVPAGAVMAGRTSGGEPLYVGRAHIDGSLTPGKVHPSHQCIYVPYGGSERRFSQYDVLVSN